MVLQVYLYFCWGFPVSVFPVRANNIFFSSHLQLNNFISVVGQSHVLMWANKGRGKQAMWGVILIRLDHSGNLC